MEINRGRKKIEKYQGIIENIYPSIFTVNIGDGKNTLSYSYSEVVCGDVVNTNASYISKHLKKYGIEVFEHMAVTDTEKEKVLGLNAKKFFSL